MQRRTRLNLALGAGVLALGVWLIADRPAPVGRVERALVPELASMPLAQITVTRRGQPPFTVVPTEPKWDPSRVRALVDAMALLAERRHSEVDPGPLDRLALTLSLEGGATVELAFGDDIETLRGVWMARKGRAGFSLVDAHVAREFDIDPNSLRARRLLADEIITSAAFPAGRVRLEPAVVETLSRLVAALEVSEPLPRSFQPAAPHIYIYGAQKLEHLGDCADGSVALRSPRAEGCVPRTRFEPLARLLSQLEAAPAALVDRNWFAASSETVTIGGETRALDNLAVREWLAALAEATTTTVVPIAAGKPLVTLTSGAETVTVYDAPLRIARTGDTAALGLTDAARALLAAPAFRFAPRRLSDHDPIDLVRAELRAGGKLIGHYQRPQTFDPSSEPAASVATLTALRAVAAAPTGAHGLGAAARQVTLFFDAAPGEAAPLPLTIRLGKSTAAGCYATTSRDGLDSIVFELPRNICGALVKL